MSFYSGIKKFYDVCQVWINLLLMIVVVFGMFWGTVKFLDYWTNHGETTEMPNVIDLDYYKARDILEAKGFKIIVDSIYDTQAKHGQVLDQKPKANEIVKHERMVYIKINSFYPQMKEVDMKLYEISASEAKRRLEASGYTRVLIDTVPGDNDEEVISIKYNGRKLGKGEKAPVTAEVILTMTKANENEVDTMSIDEVNAQIQLRDSLDKDNSGIEQ